MKAESFGFKNAWVAFRSNDPTAIAEALSLRNRRPATWVEGLEAAYEYPMGCSVFVTPPIDGWVLCVGLPLTESSDVRPPTFGDDAAAWARTLGCEVQYFATHRVVEAHAWARARPAGLERAYSYLGESGEKLLDVGPPTPEEKQLGFAFPNESHVMALAGLWSVDPSGLEERNLDVGEGLIGEYGEPPAPPPTVARPPRKPWWKVW